MELQVPLCLNGWTQFITVGSSGLSRVDAPMLLCRLKACFLGAEQWPVTLQDAPSFRAGSCFFVMQAFLLGMARRVCCVLASVSSLRRTG